MLHRTTRTNSTTGNTPGNTPDNTPDGGGTDHHPNRTARRLTRIHRDSTKALLVTTLVTAIAASALFAASTTPAYGAPGDSVPALVPSSTAMALPPAARSGDYLLPQIAGTSLTAMARRAALPAGQVGSTASLITDTPVVIAIREAAAARAAAAEAAAIPKADAAAAEAAAAERARTAQAVLAAAPVYSGDTSVGAAQAIARTMMAQRYGWGDDQFACLVSLWNRESGWRVAAYNASSGATGIPQALPGTKMATAGADWRTNPATQISWGLGYVAGRYGTACGAWQHLSSTGWY
ncbi:MAG: hypothetical protein ACSLE3_02340 [Microbacteriaceae bacterium]